MNNEVLYADAIEFADQFELSELFRFKTILITGSTGLIGSVMIRCLLALNHRKNIGCKIVAIVRNLAKARQMFEDVFDEIIFYQIDLQDLNKAVFEQKIDYVVHLANPTASSFFVQYPVETINTILSGTSAVLEFVRNNAVSAMVYASSIEVYGSNDTDEWINEEFQGYVNPVDVRSSYSLGKRAAECLCHSFSEEYAIKVVIARLTQTFGAGINSSENRVFAQFARSIINNQDIILHTDGKSSKPYCYTTDAVSALLYLLILGKAGQAYNIANPYSYVSISDLAELFREEFNRNIKVVHNLDEGHGYAPYTKLRLSTEKLVQLGWVPKCGLIEMLRRLINFLHD